jgi:hypothetical protein
MVVNVASGIALISELAALYGKRELSAALKVHQLEQSRWNGHHCRLEQSQEKTCLQLLHRSITLLRCGFTPVYALLGRFLPRLKAASGRPPFLAMTVRVRPIATRGPPRLIFRSCPRKSWASRSRTALFGRFSAL